MSFRRQGRRARGAIEPRPRWRRAATATPHMEKTWRPSVRRRWSSEAPLRALTRFAGFLLSIAWRGVNLQRVDQAVRGGGHFFDCLIERRFIGARRLGRATQLSDEL